MTMRTKLLVMLPALALALAACKKESTEGPLAGCKPAGLSTSLCAADAECCSFACEYGICTPNRVVGGVCSTNGDCAGGRVCVGGRCTIASCNPGGACTPGVGDTCCRGACTYTGVGYTCPVDTPPVAVAGRVGTANPVPIRIPIQLTNASSDLNGDAMSYTWSVIPPTGSVATFAPSTTFPTPTFTPDLAGAYSITLRAENAGGYDTDTISFSAVNTAPTISMPPDVPPDVAGTTYQSRNVPLTFSATVTDADGGPVTCAWSKKSPSAVTTPVPGLCGELVCTCAGASGMAAVGYPQFTLNEDQAGKWEVVLTVSDNVNPPVSKSRFVMVENDPPVAEAGPKRWGNFRLGAIPISGTATDVNSDVVNLTQGDGTFTWSWDVTAAPALSALAGTNVGTTSSIAFTADWPGLYTLTLTVDDHHGGPYGGVGMDSVDVQVEPYILPLGEVADAKYVDGSQRVVLVETDAGNAYHLKIVNPASLDVDYVVTLAAKPTVIGLNATQTEATVGEVGGGWQRITGIQGVPTIESTVAAGQGASANLTDVVYASSCRYGMTGGGTVYYLDVAAPFAKSAICPNCDSGVNDPIATRGVAGQAGTASWYVWLLRTTSGRLGKYQVNTSNCNLTNPAPAFRTDSTVAGKEGLWLSADQQDLFTAWTTVYDARSATLATRVATPFPLVPSHLSTTEVGADLVCAVAQNSTTALAKVSRTTVGTDFTWSADLDFPFLGHNGDAIYNYGRFAFVRTGGGEYYAIVRANVATAAAPVWKWGMVNLGP
jgi:hypothetical protein